MNILIQKAKIVDPSSPWNGKTADILIEKGIIVRIGEKLEAPSAILFGAANLHASPGWFDMQANLRDPGFEYKEDLESGALAAASGGYTGLAIMPSTQPPIHSKAEVEYIRNKSRNAIIDLYPVGTVSHLLEGNDLSEMYDMHLSGAVAFSDDKKPIKNSGLLMRALLYTKNFNRLIMTHCEERSISGDGKMNEGITSTKLGLKGMPALSEEIMVARNIQVLEYTGGQLHISSVSTAHSVTLIRKAKAQGLAISASVNSHHLALNDESLHEFDSNLKVNPPLRTAVDIEALKKGLADGTLDVIVSDHSPEDTENKELEFDHAAYGMLGLETAYALANTYSGLNPEQLMEKMSSNPRRLLGLAPVSLKEGSEANISLFDPFLTWVFGDKDIRSKSRNTPFVGHTFKGKALGIINKGQLIRN
ncbi:MAG: dihydroorotase [Bacteroidia bacterium]